MKRKVGLLALAFSLNAFSPLGDAVAKPYSCVEAYNRCLDRCNELYDEPLGLSGCYLGCSIGYWLCG